MVSNILIMSSAFVLTVILVSVIRAYALKYLIDHPNQRSSHRIPTPRGGGLAIVIVVILMTSYLFMTQRVDADVLMLSGIGLGVAAIGFWDDHSSVPVYWRLAAHVTASLAAMVCLGGFPKLLFSAVIFEWGWLGYLVGTLFLTWMLNLFNFMDGIDGIAASEAVFVSFVMAGLLYSIDSELALLQSILGMSCLGFLIWNWPPAKIFMGDVGSGFIGFLLGVFIVLDAQRNPVFLPIGLILFAVFIVDATYTLMTRVISKQKWYSAHCLHAYQKAAKRSGHFRVVKYIGLFNGLYLAPLAGFAAYYQDYAWLAVLLAFVPLIIWVRQEGAGNPD